MSNLDDLDDRELHELLEKAALADKLKTDPAWKLISEASKRIVDRAIAEFAIKTDPKDLVRIIQLQTIIKKYRFGLFEEVEALAHESGVAFDAARERGIVGDLFERVKSSLGISS